ncbi:hypothetical protein D3C86_1439240 [compost metagenome]
MQALQCPDICSSATGIQAHLRDILNTDIGTFNSAVKLIVRPFQLYIFWCGIVSCNGLGTIVATSGGGISKGKKIICIKGINQG